MTMLGQPLQRPPAVRSWMPGRSFISDESVVRSFSPHDGQQHDEARSRFKGAPFQKRSPKRRLRSRLLNYFKLLRYAVTARICSLVRLFATGFMI